MSSQGKPGRRQPQQLLNINAATVPEWDVLESGAEGTVHRSVEKVTTFPGLNVAMGRF